MAIKDAGLKRARIGADYCEFEFADEREPEVVAAAPVLVTTVPQTVQDKREPEIKRPGYAALFNEPPRFEPAK